MGAAYLRRGPHSAVADAVAAKIRGENDAKRAVQLVREGKAHEDTLLQTLRQQQTAGEPGRLDAFVRELQRTLARAVEGTG